MAVPPQEPHFCLDCGEPLYYSYNANYCKKCQDKFNMEARRIYTSEAKKEKQRIYSSVYYQNHKKRVADYQKTLRLIKRIENLEKISDEEKNEIIKNLYRKYYARHGKLKEIA